MPKKGYKQTKEHRKKISNSVKKNGIIPPSALDKHFPKTNKTKIKMSLSHKGKTFSKETKRKMCESSPKFWLGKHFSEDTRKKMSNIRKGEKSHFWKGGMTKKNHKIRMSIEIRLWREAVLARDNYTCQKTKIRGGLLNAHHIKNFAEYPALRTSIENGITLSKKMHDKFHKIYGKKNNTKKQLKEFLIK